MEKLTESDTCPKFVVPKLMAAGWDNDPHSDGDNPGGRCDQACDFFAQAELSELNEDLDTYNDIHYI